MQVEDLVTALLRYDSLAALQWIADAARADLRWDTVPEPRDLDPRAKIVAAGIVEMLAGRAGVRPPAWTSTIGPSEQPILLVRSATRMRHLMELCESSGPEPLRARRVLAPPDFLTAA